VDLFRWTCGVYELVDTCGVYEHVDVIYMCYLLLHVILSCMYVCMCVCVYIYSLHIRFKCRLGQDHANQECVK
jgi:hypothetical protein